MIRSKEWNFTLIFFRAEISICTVRHIIFLQDKCAVFHVPKLDQKKTINHVMAWERKQRSDFPLFPLSPHPCTSPFPYLFLFLPSCLISSPLRPPSSPFHPSSISSLLFSAFSLLFFCFFHPCSGQCFRATSSSLSLFATELFFSSLLGFERKDM